MTLTANHDDESELDHAAYVLGSKYRQAVLEELAGNPTNPSSIADTRNLARSHVSRALTELRERDLVQAHSAESRTKLYSLTDAGEEVANVVDDLNDGDSQ